jgi:peroxiredoxin
VEAPHLSRLAEQYRDDGLVVLGVSAWDEPKSEVARFVRENRLKYRVLLNGKKVAQQYNLLGVPTLFWIDRQGIVVDAEVGFDGPQELERKTRALLALGE